MWKFMHDSDEVHIGSPTDARGLRFRQECGYSYVDMGDGWWQIGMARRLLQQQLINDNGSIVRLS